MNEKAKAFVVAVNSDPEKKAALEGIQRPKDQAELDQMMEDKIIPMAKTMGYDLTLDDFKENYNGEVDDSELDQVAGGSGGCGCMVAGGGGGQEDKEDYGQTYGCACVGYGQGGDCNNVNDNCICPAVGSGSDIHFSEIGRASCRERV